MKRSCFALSILMASLSGSLLWGDAARSHNRGSIAAVAPRDATPRPPKVEDDRPFDSTEYDCGDYVCGEFDCPGRSDDAAYSDFDCGYAYDTCTYDPRLHEPRGSLAASHPADLPEGFTESESEIVDEAAAVDPMLLSHYDPVYDAAVYGVAPVELEPSAAAQETYVHQTYDYRAYSEPECYDDRYDCFGYDYGHVEVAEVDVSESGSSGESQLYGHYYEYDCDYHYNYEFEYDYQYEYDDTGAESGPSPFGAAVAFLRDFLGQSLHRCEPIQTTVAAGCQIVGWSSGVDVARLWDVAGAEIADLPADDEAKTTR